MISVSIDCRAHRVLISGLCPPAAPPSHILNEVEDSEEIVDGKAEMQMEQPNAMSLTLKKKSNFVWKETGFTECSESCLGGEFGTSVPDLF